MLMVRAGRLTRILGLLQLAVILNVVGCGGSSPESAPPPPPPGNSAPSILGTPSTIATVGQNYLFMPTANDADGDTLSFSAVNIPVWAQLNAANGSLSGIPVQGDVGTYPAISISVSDGMASVSLPDFQINVSTPPPGNSPPTISGTPPTAITVGQSYSFTPSADDPDGDNLTFAISNQPSWATFNLTSGALNGAPGAGNVGTYPGISIAVSDGMASVSLPAFQVDVSAAPPGNSPPTISGTPPTTATVSQLYTFTPTANDPDGDTLAFSIGNQPSWATFNSTNGALNGTPGAADVGAYPGISIAVSDGMASVSLPAFQVDVSAAPPGNSPPTISGAPPTTATVSQLYTFTPTANDPDGDTLAFSIGNQPSWATFNSTNGALNGTPGAADVGAYPGISIAVSDGMASASLTAFQVDVSAAPPGNSPPTISGTPPTTATVSQLYTFTPTANDPDGDTLAFAINNQPTWLTFDQVSGVLTGTPGQADIGTYSAIAISVSDGIATATLPDFSIVVSAAPTGSVLLTWTPPTQSADGSSLNDLDGYEVHWGIQPGTYQNVMPVTDPNATSATVSNLTTGTYFFAVKAVDTSNNTSIFSNEAMKVVP